MVARLLLRLYLAKVTGIQPSKSHHKLRIFIEWNTCRGSMFQALLPQPTGQLQILLHVVSVGAIPRKLVHGQGVELSGFPTPYLVRVEQRFLRFTLFPSLLRIQELIFLLSFSTSVMRRKDGASESHSFFALAHVLRLYRSSSPGCTPDSNRRHSACRAL